MDICWLGGDGWRGKFFHKAVNAVAGTLVGEENFFVAIRIADLRQGNYQNGLLDVIENNHVVIESKGQVG